jgi:glycerophosphoryl diester phosphodiesterase
VAKTSFRRWIFASGILAMVNLLGNAAVLSTAHRGGSLYAPENTVAAFTNSRAITHLMETDAQITSDGKLVIMHDLSVNRTTIDTGWVAMQTLAQLKLLDAGSWFAPRYTG